MRADRDALPAFHTLVGVDKGLPLPHLRGPIGTPIDTGPTPHTRLPFHLGTEGGVLAQLPLPAGAPHPDVLKSPAEPGEFVSLKVCYPDEGISIIDRMGDAYLLKGLPVDRHPHCGVPHEAVSDNDGGTDYREGKTIFLRCGEV